MLFHHITILSSRDIEAIDHYENAFDRRSERARYRVNVFIETDRTDDSASVIMRVNQSVMN